MVPEDSAYLEKLDEMELRLKGILGAIPAGVVFIAMDGRVEAVTDQFEILSELDSRDICGRNISKFIQSPYSEQELATRLAKCCSDGIIVGRGSKKSGLEIPINFTVSMIDTAEGVGMMLCILDASKKSDL